ncbi:Uncharacterised protein [Acinetobacter phage MD-2021a]|nr:Uncharacterised protein [Acinetobacter phage MD-2021a]CAH1088971.1 Uncharacterised protein [Acinetobacter phage MD-2021a]
MSKSLYILELYECYGIERISIIGYTESLDVATTIEKSYEADENYYVIVTEIKEIKL